MKNEVKILADKLLKEKSPFKKISYLTGWTTEEIWLYIDMEYRRKNPEQCEDHKEYFCWGQTKPKTK